LGRERGWSGGPTAEVKLYEQTPLPEALQDKPRWGEKAYVAADPVRQTPHKKPQGAALSEVQKAENRHLSSQRVRVEHGIRRVKGFRLTRDEYRLAVRFFSSVVAVVVGLLQFSRNSYCRRQSEAISSPSIGASSEPDSAKGEPSRGRATPHAGEGRTIQRI
jgi:hypothetical protein